MKLIIQGNTPSQKNRKIISRMGKGGRPFLRTAPKVKEWQYSANEQLKEQFHGYKVTDYPITITVIVFFDNLRRHDLDNALGSVMDALAASLEEDDEGNPIEGTGVITDDSVQYVECITVQYGGHDKINPRAEIYIDE